MTRVVFSVGRPKFGLQLRQKLLRPYDGARHQLRKEGDVGGKGKQGGWTGQGATMHIHDVADGLERVKRDAHGKHPLVQTPRLQRALQGASGKEVCDEVGVFEHAQHHKVESNSSAKEEVTKWALLRPHGPCEEVVD